MGQAVPEIPLNVRSKLELLLRAFVFARFLYTSPYTHAFIRVCILPCIYDCVNYIHDSTEAPRVLHFSAFILTGSGGRVHPPRHQLSQTAADFPLGLYIDKREKASVQ